MTLVFSLRDYYRQSKNRRTMWFYTAHTLQNTKPVVDKSSLQITDYATEIFNHFSLFATGVSELYVIRRFASFEYI